jgi:hypothetical protein
VNVDHIRVEIVEFTEYGFGPLRFRASNHGMRETLEQIVLPLDSPPETAVEFGFSSGFGEDHQKFHTRIGGDTAIHWAEVLDGMRNNDYYALADRLG